MTRSQYNEFCEQEMIRTHTNKRARQLAIFKVNGDYMAQSAAEKREQATVNHARDFLGVMA